MDFELEEETSRDRRDVATSRALAPAPRFLKPFFYKLGVFVGSRPLLTILLSLVFVGICAAGILLTVKETGYAMWFPRHSRAYKDQARVEQFFETSNRASRAILVEKIPGTALHRTALTEANAFHSALIGADASTADMMGNATVFEQLCVRAFTGGPCSVHSVLSVWKFNSTQIISDANPVLTLSNHPEMNSSAGTSVRTWFGQPVPLELVLGGENGGDVQNATALQFVYELDKDAIARVQDSNSNTTVSITTSAFERDHWIPTCLSTELEHYEVYCNADRSW